MHPETLLQHLGEDHKIGGAVTPPIFQTSLFTFDDVEVLHEKINENPGGTPYYYSRMGNPTNALVEQKIAAMEGTEAAKLYASGITAISSTILNVIESGDHIVVIDTAYKPVKLMLENFLPKLKVSFTYVDGMTLESVLDAIKPETKLIYLESPSTFLFRLQPIEAICREAKARGITTIIDNTYSTPLLQNPAKYGIDYVVHSASKYMGGHSDLIAGVVCCNQERMDRLVDELQFIGSALPPFPAWLLLRGLRTLPMRLQRHAETAQTLAEWLETRAEVERVHHVGLASYPQRELFEAQMSGSGGIFSFEPVRQDRDYIVRLVNSLEVFSIGVSWGGHESLCLPLHLQPMGYLEPRYVVRISCGLEDADDLRQDLDQAFAHASAVP